MTLELQEAGFLSTLPNITFPFPLLSSVPNADLSSQYPLSHHDSASIVIPYFNPYHIELCLSGLLIQVIVSQSALNMYYNIISEYLSQYFK